MMTAITQPASTVMRHATRRGGGKRVSASEKANGTMAARQTPSRAAHTSISNPDSASSTTADEPETNYRNTNALLAQSQLDAAAQPLRWKCLTTWGEQPISGNDPPTGGSFFVWTLVGFQAGDKTGSGGVVLRPVCNPRWGGGGGSSKLIAPTDTSVSSSVPSSPLPPLARCKQPPPSQTASVAIYTKPILSTHAASPHHKTSMETALRRAKKTHPPTYYFSPNQPN